MKSHVQISKIIIGAFTNLSDKIVNKFYRKLVPKRYKFTYIEPQVRLEFKLKGYEEWN
jgi:hypothetical protein